VPTGASGTPSIEVTALADLESPVLRKVAGLWQAWRGAARMPPREKLSLRELAGAVKHISLARVLNGGEDYEFRIVGDAHVQALGAGPLHRRVSDVIAVSPKFGQQIKASYDLVRETRGAWAFRSQIGWDAPDTRFVLFETCYLPLGPDADTVDHILNAAVYAPQSFR
jgi:hypothetical protein